MMSGNYTTIDNQNVSGSVPAVSDPPGQVSVKFNDSTSLQTFPPSGAAHGKIASAGGPPRDADGVGLNVDNDKPTTSLNAALRKLNFGYQMQREDITSAFFNKFEHPFHTLINQGFRPLEELYYKTWLHSGQRVVVQEKTKDQDMLMENVVTVQADKSLGQKVASRLNVKPSY